MPQYPGFARTGQASNIYASKLDPILLKNRKAALIVFLMSANGEKQTSHLTPDCVPQRHFQKGAGVP